METTRQHANLTLKRPAHWIALLFVSLVGAVVVVACVALVSMGPSELKSSVLTWLDDQHVTGPRTAMLRAAHTIEGADPAEDARTAVAAGDPRLIPVAGVGAFFPGLPDEAFSDYQRRYGAKPPLYTGCVSESAEESRYRTAAFNYATSYNRAIVAQVTR